jgi:hypothetical protein
MFEASASVFNTDASSTKSICLQSRLLWRTGNGLSSGNYSWLVRPLVHSEIC